MVISVEPQSSYDSRQAFPGLHVAGHDGRASHRRWEILRIGSSKFGSVLRGEEHQSPGLAVIFIRRKYGRKHYVVGNDLCLIGRNLFRSYRPAIGEGTEGIHQIADLGI